METGGTEHPLAKIESALDRFRESHFWIHTLEQFYHYSDPFRWHLNAFLKSLKEVPQLIQMGLQNEENFPTWFREEKDRLLSDPLMKFLSEQRDFVVHRGMLVPNSYGGIGLTEGRGFKAGLTFPIHPMEDSDGAMERYLHMVVGHRDFLELLVPDDDSLPCVHRIWRVLPFKEEIVDLAARAWLRTGETVNAVVEWMGVEPQELSLDCRHSSQTVQYKLYDREKLSEQLDVMRSKTQH
ncbi:MAG: hypothetical protein HYS46_04525 [Betaproteobacteria bacterium]|nr:hypothetical protein [Betaproteobacteria bacterium]